MHSLFRPICCEIAFIRNQILVSKNQYFLGVFYIMNWNSFLVYPVRSSISCLICLELPLISAVSLASNNVWSHFVFGCLKATIKTLLITLSNWAIMALSSISLASFLSSPFQPVLFLHYKQKDLCANVIKLSHSMQRPCPVSLAREKMLLMERIRGWMEAGKWVGEGVPGIWSP